MSGPAPAVTSNPSRHDPRWRADVHPTGSCFMRRLATGATACMLAFVAFAPRDGFAHAATSNTVLFDREIVRILNEHCVMCHASSGPSFPLESYEEAWVRRRAMHDSVLAGSMPVWAAVSGYGEFLNSSALTLREKRFLVSWVEGLGPRNAGEVFLNVLDPGAVRPAAVRAEPNFDIWQLGDPDVQIELPGARIEPAAPTFVVRAAFDTGLAEPRSVAALEFRPADRRFVRAAWFFEEDSGRWLGSWTPWQGFTRLPDGFAWQLEPGARIVAEIHYVSSQAERLAGQGTLGLYFASGRTSGPRGLVLEARGEDRANGEGKRYFAETTLVSDSRILALRPEVASGIESVEVAARTPDGGTEILLLAIDAAADWPTPYVFAKPVSLPQGTRLSLVVYYGETGATAPATLSLDVRHAE